MSSEASNSVVVNRLRRRGARTLLVVDLSRLTPLQPTTEKRGGSTADRWVAASRTLPPVPKGRSMAATAPRIESPQRLGATVEEAVANVKTSKGKQIVETNYDNSSSSAFASRKSIVSNPSVNVP